MDFGGLLGLNVVDNVEYISWVRRARDNGSDAGGGRETGCDYFGGHAACAEGGAGSGHVGFERRYIFDDFDCFGVGVRPRVLVV